MTSEEIEYIRKIDEEIEAKRGKYRGKICENARNLLNCDDDEFYARFPWRKPVEPIEKLSQHQIDKMGKNERIALYSSLIAKMKKLPTASLGERLAGLVAKNRELAEHILGRPLSDLGDLLDEEATL